jgi:RNA polymerase sigma-70 factor (ECF subfamily)
VSWLQVRREPRDPGDRVALKALVANSFRHDYGRLVSTLVCRAGAQYLELVEDAVQHALVTALAAWENAVPDEPTAWLYCVAHNKLVQDLRRDQGHARILERTSDPAPLDPPDAFFADEIPDDMLRMLFLCCDETIPSPSQLVLALKTLCGFSTPEIAHRLFTSEANVHKRLARARDRLRLVGPEIGTPPIDTLRARLGGVYGVLYLLFNEGYLSMHHEHAIRRELCDEAVRLATLLAEHPIGAVSESFALLALMHLHAARLDARVDASGGLLLLEEQDRALWDRERIHDGMAWLQRSASGDTFSRFHAEAGIAAEHCLAPSFAETRWAAIAELYATLERVAPSPLHTLNRAIAIAEHEGAAAGLAIVEDLAPPSWLAGSYFWDAVLADLHRRAGHRERSDHHRARAIESAPTDAVRDLLRRRLS